VRRIEGRLTGRGLRCPGAWIKVPTRGGREIRSRVGREQKRNKGIIWAGCRRWTQAPSSWRARTRRWRSWRRRGGRSRRQSGRSSWHGRSPSMASPLATWSWQGTEHVRRASDRPSTSPCLPTRGKRPRRPWRHSATRGRPRCTGSERAQQLRVRRGESCAFASRLPRRGEADADAQSNVAIFGSDVVFGERVRGVRVTEKDFWAWA
jgi:hypothetical protein